MPSSSGSSTEHYPDLTKLKEPNGEYSGNAPTVTAVAAIVGISSSSSSLESSYDNCKKNVMESEEVIVLPNLSLSEAVIIPETANEDDDDDEGLIPPSPETYGAARRLCPIIYSSSKSESSTQIAPSDTQEDKSLKMSTSKKLSFSQDSDLDQNTPVQTKLQLVSYIHRNLEPALEMETDDATATNRTKRGYSETKDDQGSEETQSSQETELSPKRRREFDDSQPLSPSAGRTYRMLPRKEGDKLAQMKSTPARNGNTKTTTHLQELMEGNEPDEFGISPVLTSSTGHISQAGARVASQAGGSTFDSGDWCLQLTEGTEPQTSINLGEHDVKSSQDPVTPRKCSTGEPPKTDHSLPNLSNINDSIEDDLPRPFQQSPPLLNSESAFQPSSETNPKPPMSVFHKVQQKQDELMASTSATLETSSKSLGSTVFNSSSSEEFDHLNCDVSLGNNTNESLDTSFQYNQSKDLTLPQSEDSELQLRTFRVIKGRNRQTVVQDSHNYESDNSLTDFVKPQLIIQPPSGRPLDKDSKRLKKSNLNTPSDPSLSSGAHTSSSQESDKEEKLVKRPPINLLVTYQPFANDAGVVVKSVLVRKLDVSEEDVAFFLRSSTSLSSLTSGELADISSYPSSKTSDTTGSLDRSKALSSSSLDKSPPLSSSRATDHQHFTRPLPAKFKTTKKTPTNDLPLGIQSLDKQTASEIEILHEEENIKVIAATARKRGRPRKYTQPNPLSTDTDSSPPMISPSKKVNTPAKKINTSAKKITTSAKKVNIPIKQTKTPFKRGKKSPFKTPARNESGSIESDCQSTAIYTGLKVFAKYYNDGNFYTGTVGNHDQPDKWTVIFDDDYSQGTKEIDIISRQLIREGQSVMAIYLGFPEPGIINKFYTRENEEGYVVDLDQGITINSVKKDVSLTADQAKDLINYRLTGFPTASVTLDNIVDGKRRRTPTLSYSLLIEQKELSAKKPDPNLQTTEEDMSMTDQETPKFLHKTPKSRKGKKTTLVSTKLTTPETETTHLQTPKSPLKASQTPPKSPLKASQIPPKSPLKVSQTPPKSPLKSPTTPPKSPKSPNPVDSTDSSGGQLETRRSPRTIHKKLSPCSECSNTSSRSPSKSKDKTFSSASPTSSAQPSSAQPSSSRQSSSRQSSSRQSPSQPSSSELSSSQPSRLRVQRNSPRIKECGSLSPTKDKSKDEISNETSAGPIPDENNFFEGMYFLISCSERCVRQPDESDSESSFQINRDYLELQLTKGGGIILECFEETQIIADPKQVFLLASNYLRTLKYVKCLASGIYCINAQWVEQCCLLKTKLDIFDFVLPAGYSLTNQKTISWHGCNNMLKKLKTLLVSKQNPHFNDTWKPVLMAANAEAIYQINPDIDVLRVLNVIVSDPSCPPKIVGQAKRLNIPIVSTEWVIQCLIHGKKLPTDLHPKFKYNYKE